ncbi:MAG: hypothetical protein PHI98_15855 [Eubacteriales bacterium]|nr:hypothetical protein [Eubacteriales bacterium]
MNKIKEFLGSVWKRITSSKVAWMALPLAGAQMWLAVSGQDVSEEVNVIFGAVWSVLTVFLAVNNPTDKANF